MFMVAFFLLLNISYYFRHSRAAGWWLTVIDWRIRVNEICWGEFIIWLCPPQISNVHKN